MNHLNDGAEPMAGGAFKSAHARTVEKHGGTDSFAAAVMNIATDPVYELDVGTGLAVQLLLNMGQTILDQLEEILWLQFALFTTSLLNFVT